MSNNKTRTLTGMKYNVATHNGNTDDINSKFTLTWKNMHKVVIIVLFVIVIFLVIGLIVLCNKYIFVTKENPKRMCLSNECLKSAANLKNSMDINVDPCEDFYAYTCGKWSNEHIDHDWYTTYSAYDTIEERVVIAASKFLKSNGTEDDPLSVKQSRDLYKSCVDEDTLDELGYSVILKYLKLVDLPEVPRYFTSKKTERKKLDFDWIKVDVKVKKVLARDLFFEFSVNTNVYNSSINSMYVGSARNLSPLPSPSRPKRKIPKIQAVQRKTGDSEEEEDETDVEESNSKAVIKEVMETVLLETLDDIDEEDLENAVEIIYNVTQKLSAISSAEQDFFEGNDDYRFNYKKINITKLQNVTENILLKDIDYPPKKYLWFRYINLLFEDIDNVTIDFNNDKVYFLLSELKNVLTVIKYISETPGLHLELYAWYQTVYAMIKSTTTEMSDFVSEDYESTKTRSIYCTEVVIQYMSMAVSYGIADKDFLKSTKPRVSAMLNNIRKAFIEILEKNTWMDERTKIAIKEKNEKMISYIGIPEWLWNSTAIEEYYDDIVIKNDTFLENLLSIVGTYIPPTLQSLRETNPTRGDWSDPTTVNAYNNFDNVINIPIAILSFPFYHLGLEVLNYGATGSTLGHELMHSFDRSGRDFDKYGNYKQYWSNKSVEIFDSKTKCFILQYENFTIPNVNATINGTQTLDENISDNEGLDYTYWAYKKYQLEHGSEPQLPGFANYTDDQLFFLAYGSTWCETPGSENIENLLLYDTHPPLYVRLWGTVQNSAEFAKAFNCPIGSKMNPNRSRCGIY